MRTLHCILTGVLAGLLLLTVPAFAQWGNFTTDTLDAPVAMLQRTTDLESLEIDDSGFLHALWTSERTGPAGGVWVLYNTTRPTGEWNAIPDTVNAAEQIAYSPVLAVMPESGDPLVAFEANDELILAHYVGGEWSHQTICGMPMFLCCPSIDVDASGTPHLAWIGEEEFVDIYHIGYLRVLWGADPQLLMDSQLGTFGLGANPRIAVSPEGVAHITYRGGGYEDYHIIHAYNSGSGDPSFAHEGLFTPNQEDLTSDIVASGRALHVAVCGDDGWGMPGHVYYFVKSDSGWSPPEDISGRLSATGASLALDGTGAPHTLLMELSGNLLTGTVHYFSRAAGFWSGFPLIGEDHGNPCLRVDSDGYGHALMNTGGNSGQYSVLHLRSETPLSEAPQILIEPDSLDFGYVPIQHDSTQFITIANTGTAPLSIDSAECTLSFSINFPHLPLVIEPGQQIQPGVTFSPGMTHEYNGACSIYHNALGHVATIVLHGTAVLGGAPGAFSRLLPADNSTDPWSEVPNIRFVWSASVDPDQDPISYSLRVFDPINGWEENVTTLDTSCIVTMPIPVLDETIVFHWTVYATDGHYVVAAENGTGAFFITIESADDPPLAARDFELAAYPNPFNGTATLTYSLPRAMPVTLSVFDVQGRLIQTFVDGDAAAGAHRVSFDARMLATGVYFARLETADMMRTHKLLLLK
ncbi:MAG: T9SS type A sorting domain-containing protein [bacterium]|nr:T9SS type A sorting domain-containing protein [bacterium]